MQPVVSGGVTDVGIRVVVDRDQRQQRLAELKSRSCQALRRAKNRPRSLSATGVSSRLARLGERDVTQAFGSLRTDFPPCPRAVSTTRDHLRVLRPSCVSPRPHAARHGAADWLLATVVNPSRCVAREASSAALRGARGGRDARQTRSAARPCS